MTSDQLRKEREAFMERRRKQMEEARAQRADQEAPQTRVLSRAEKLKMREDEYIPPDE